MVFNCGTTSGISPYGRVASTSRSYVIIPWTSQVRACASIASTSVNPLTSSPGAAAGARNRNRFEVRLARRTGVPAGIAAYCARRAATARACASCGSGGAATVTDAGRSLSTVARYLVGPGVRCDPNR